MQAAVLGILGGSGLYDLLDPAVAVRRTIETPFGAPSDAVVTGTLAGTPVAFLPRHGVGHRFLPGEVPYLANIWALKSLGCELVVSVSAVGSLREEIAPGHMVLVDQFIDRTIARPRSFFGNGVVGHVPFGDPVCPTLRALLLEAVRSTGAVTHDGGTYVCIEGPTFSTRAESELFRSWGASVVGMTNLPEARLAREAGLSYATLALATDYDCWHPQHDAVSVEAVVAVLQANVATARRAIAELARVLAQPGAMRQSPYRDVTRHAVMTAPGAIPRAAAERLRLIAPHLLP